jgi:hypothetical protein
VVLDGHAARCMKDKPVFDHASQHTYSPDGFDLLRALIAWLSSPGGNLLWDLFVAGRGIIVTVTQRYVDRLEERRWAPARTRAYARLFMRVSGLMSHIPYPRRVSLRLQAGDREMFWSHIDIRLLG